MGIIKIDCRKVKVKDILHKLTNKISSLKKLRAEIESSGLEKNGTLVAIDRQIENFQEVLKWFETEE